MNKKLPPNVKLALDIYDDLPNHYKVIAQRFLENQVLGKKKENERIMKWTEMIAKKEKKSVEDDR